MHIKNARKNIRSCAQSAKKSMKRDMYYVTPALQHEAGQFWSEERRDVQKASASSAVRHYKKD